MVTAAHYHTVSDGNIETYITIRFVATLGINGTKTSMAERDHTLRGVNLVKAVGEDEISHQRIPTTNKKCVTCPLASGE